MTTNNRYQRVRDIEEVAADAVPAAVVEQLDGWRLRFNHGVKRRPNSVLANADGGALSVEEKIARAEAFYAAHGLRTRFQLSPASVPTDLDTLLGARGYVRAGEPVCVQVAALSGSTDAHSVEGGFTVALLEHPTRAWFTLYTEVEGLSGTKAVALRDMLGKLPGESVFALAYDGAGRPAATGVGVARGGLLGIFNVATHPRARRQGLATALTTELRAWGGRRGASGAYLQVAANNACARSVYERLGVYDTLRILLPRAILNAYRLRPRCADAYPKLRRCAAHHVTWALGSTFRRSETRRGQSS